MGSFLLGVEVKQSEENIFVSQEAYANEVLKRFKIENYKPLCTPTECGINPRQHDDDEIIDALRKKKLSGKLKLLGMCKT